MPQSQILTATRATEDLFFDDLLDEVKTHPALKHPFLIRFSEEPLTRDQLSAFAVQHYLYSRLFARNLAAAISNVPDETARNLLVLNMYEEIGEPNRVNDQVHYLLIKERLVPGPIMGVALESAARGLRGLGMTDFLVEEKFVTRDEVEGLLARHRSRAADATHPALFRRFLRALGLESENLLAAQPLPETSAFIREFEAVCRETSWLEALGGLGPGTECVVPTLYSFLLRGIERSRVVAAPDYIFWTIHVQCDDEHGKNIVQSLQPHAVTSKARASIRRGALRVLDARNRWFDALERHVFW